MISWNSYKTLYDLLTAFPRKNPINNFLMAPKNDRILFLDIYLHFRNTACQFIIKWQNYVQSHWRNVICLFLILSLGVSMSAQNIIFNHKSIHTYNACTFNVLNVLYANCLSLHFFSSFSYRFFAIFLLHVASVPVLLTNLKLPTKIHKFSSTSKWTQFVDGMRVKWHTNLQR